MPIYVETLSSDVTVVEGELPLSEAQLERLARLVLRRLEEQQRAAQKVYQATRLRERAAPPTPIGE